MSEQLSITDLQRSSESYRLAAGGWAFAAGTLLGAEIAAGDSLIKTAALTTLMSIGALYNNERRTHLDDEVEMLASGAGQQG